MTRGLEFQFQLYCFNLPFMLRQVVPQLVLCLVSLLSYFTDTDVLPNVILLSIALIELLSNFGSSQYDTSNFNIFQLNLLAIIVINFMLLIIGTNNFYSPDRDIIDIDSQHWCFWVAVTIGIFFLASNLLIFAYFGWKVIHYPQMNTYKQGNCLWMWHEEMVREMIN